jgi:hypothetical protein
MRILLLSILLVLASLIVQAATRPLVFQTYRSPDGAIRVKISRLSRRCVESRIEIQKVNGSLLLRKLFASADCEHGMAAQYGAWTSDGQFFVFNAQSTGGHQPWHWPVYFYSRRDNKVRNLDIYVGAIVAPQFELKGQHSVETRVLEMDNDRGRPITANLALIAKRPRR